MRPWPIRAATRAAPQPALGEAKRLVILGATGAIGRSCARVIGETAGRFGVAAGEVAEGKAIHHIARDRAAALLA